MAPSPDECARSVLETVPMVMRAIRQEMRSHRESGLSVPQFRVLIYLARNEGASLSEVAGHLGLTLPATSKMIDVLVARNLVSRGRAPGDRRRVALAPTELGRSSTRTAREATQSRLAERLALLAPSELSTVLSALGALGSIFSSDPQIATREKEQHANPGN
ncbi:MAG: MarR family winged helix-turn-helix transcriptional regulator [Syntrophobacteraceae bacterium]|nr:MarR family winged helix-turn-helix transcriptional regulator [Syntrophobacteraceae bacterium]